MDVQCFLNISDLRLRRTEEWPEAGDGPNTSLNVPGHNNLMVTLTHFLSQDSHKYSDCFDPHSAVAGAGVRWSRLTQPHWA